MPLELTGLGLCLIGMISLLCYPCHRRLNFSKLTCAVIIAIILSLGSKLTVGFIYWVNSELSVNSICRYSIIYQIPLDNGGSMLFI